MGEPKRMFIGGKGSLYRIKEYIGMWEDDEKHGMGILTYFNGDKIEGTMWKGQPNGVVQYHFATTKKIRYAHYEQGLRVKWMDAKVRKVKTMLRVLANSIDSMD